MSTLEKIEQMAHDVQIAVQASQRALGTQEILAQRILGFEQSSASLGKIVSALTKVLIDAGVTTDQQIYSAILKVEEEGDKHEVEVFLKNDVIEKADTVTENSLVVVSQSIIDDDSSYIGYRLYKLMDKSTPDVFVQDLMGRECGAILTIPMANDKKLSVVVKEIYQLKQQVE